MNNKGISNVMIAVALAVVAFAVALYYVVNDLSLDNIAQRLRNNESAYEMQEFENVEEPEGTPEVIDNETLDELDTLMDSTEDGVVIEEELYMEVQGLSTSR